MLIYDPLSNSDLSHTTNLRNRFPDERGSLGGGGGGGASVEADGDDDP